MRIRNLIDSKGMVYSSNVYLILGDWNTLDDVNTLIDVGSDPSVLEKILTISTGVGKKTIDQVILTHGHFDHTSLLPAVCQQFAPKVYAHPMLAGAIALKDGQTLRCGDRLFEVIYTPGHSEDSLCLYCQTDGVLFVGDVPVIIRSSEVTYEERFITALERICAKQVKTIYFGHGDPITENAQRLLRDSLANAQKHCLAK